jgi:PAS domain S-box-containing protein
VKPEGLPPPKFRIPPSEELLRLIFESARDFAIFSTDEAGLVTSWNAGAERLLGFKEEEILGKTSDVIFPADSKGAAAAERRSASISGKAEDERWQMRKDGSLFWASGLLMRLAEPGAGFVKIIQDQTAKHNSDVRLSESEERFRLLATNIPQLVFVGLVDGQRTWPSPQWIEFTGLGFKESLKLGWLDAVHPEDRQSTIEAWRSAARTGEYSAEQRIRWGKTGQYRWHQTRARPIGDQRATEWVGTMTDIDDIRSLQGRQQVLLAELQHRTRNLLALVQAIARQTLRTTAAPEEFVENFNQRLQALSRVQALVGEGNSKPISLRMLLSAELDAQAGDAATDRISLRGPDVSLPPFSAQALGLAIHELCTNAVKYGALREETGKLDIEWKHVWKSQESWMELQWTESGVKLARADGPSRKGYGSQLIERALPYQLNAITQLEFRDDGVFCAITVPLKAAETSSGDQLPSPPIKH